MNRAARTRRLKTKRVKRRLMLRGSRGRPWLAREEGRRSPAKAARQGRTRKRRKKTTYKINGTDAAEATEAADGPETNNVSPRHRQNHPTLKNKAGPGRKNFERRGDGRPYESREKTRRKRKGAEARPPPKPRRRKSERLTPSDWEKRREKKKGARAPWSLPTVGDTELAPCGMLRSGRSGKEGGTAYFFKGSAACKGAQGGDRSPSDLAYSRPLPWTPVVTSTGEKGTDQPGVSKRNERDAG